MSRDFGLGTGPCGDEDSGAAKKVGGGIAMGVGGLIALLALAIREQPAEPAD
jgi:hypothetical protein